MRQQANRKFKSRRQEVQHQLALLSLSRGPRRVPAGPESEPSATEHVRRLCQVLVSLGPVFSAFGLYLSSRLDLLSADDCRQLSLIPNSARPLPREEVLARIERELGRPPECAYADFEGEPFESRLSYQAHRAWLNEGSAVEVRIPRRDVEDLELLPLLKDAVTARGPGAAAFERAVDEFGSAWERQMDMSHQARALEAIGRDAEEFDLLGAAEVERSLSTSGVLTARQRSGLRLDHWLDSAGASGVCRKDIARRLSMAWLRQLLSGRAFPVDPRAENIFVLANRQIVFIGGELVLPPSERRANLSDYLVAVASDNPDRACSCLLKEIGNEDEPEPTQELRRRFRQTVPFRDAGWNNESESRGLADYLFIHWRAAHECGYVIGDYALAFFRGCLAISDTVRKVWPGEDMLAESLRDVRLISGMSQFREMTAPNEMFALLEKYAATMMELPRTLDGVLSAAANGSARLKINLPDARAQRRRKNTAATTVSLLLALAAAVVVLHRLGQAAAGGAWVRGLNVAVYALVGAAVLWAASRIG